MCTIVGLFSLSLYFGTLLISNSDYQEPVTIVARVENDYQFYIKGDSIIRLSLNEHFNTCNTDGRIKKCSLIYDDIVSAYDINKKAELKEYHEKAAIIVINDIINNTKTNNITITTNWNNRYTSDELIELIENKDKKITINFKKDIDEKELTTKKTKSYTVKFDTKGGSTVQSVKVKKNNKVKNPGKPTKKGYTFVEWQLDGKKYNFDSKVKKDITLVAKWKKNKKSA